MSTIIRMLKIALIGITLFAGQLFSQYSPDNQLDINNASLGQIEQLPVSPNQAKALYESVTYKAPFRDIYEVLKVKYMDRETWNKIKPLLWLEPYEEKNDRERRMETVLYQIERLEGAEGFNQALMDLWMDKILEPVDINSIRYDELLNLQNVNAVDATAIINYRQNTGRISSTRNLRGIPGLSYYGYRNLRNFVSYEKETRARDDFRGHLVIRQDMTPFYGAGDESGLNTAANFTLTTNMVPNLYAKGRFSLGENLRFGFAQQRNLGEPERYRDPKGFSPEFLPRSKMYLGFEGLKIGDFEIRKIYLGSYNLGFGQGVVMETTDQFTPRKDGMGFRKRMLGINPDASLNRQWYMNGVATELAYKWISLDLFISQNRRDAILSNSKKVTVRGVEYAPINQFITLNQRIPEFTGNRYFEDEANGNWLQSVEEVTYGGHMDFHIPGLTGTKVGATYYESLYDKPLDPDIYDIVAAGNSSRVNALDDAEILNAYGGPISLGVSSLWRKAVSFRRVYGVDFSTVWKNIAVNGEYAELDKARGLGSNPSAMVFSLFSQWESFNFFALYRDYDIEFDNPYQRSFSNYQRYKGSIYEDYYYLDSEAFGQLYANAYQPQSEHGIFLRSRYQVSRSIVLSMDLDTFERKTDRAKNYRWVFNIRYSPIFPLRFYIRYKDQSRERDNDVTPNKFYRSRELRVRTSFRLSGYDELGMFFNTSDLDLSPRPRLSYPVEEGDDREDKVEGNAGLPGSAIGTYWTHNFNQFLRFKGAVTYYKGFLWNFEDTQFVVLDNLNGSMRWWAMLFIRLNQNLTMRLKYTVDRQVPVIDQHARNYQTNERDTIDSGYINDAVDRQSDYARAFEHLYFLELNYYF